MIWELSYKADPRAREVADRHYNRQKPGTPQFVPPGRALVLYTETETGRAFWVTSYPFAQYVRHAWAGAWVDFTQGLDIRLIEGVEDLVTAIKIKRIHFAWDNPEQNLRPYFEKFRKKCDLNYSKLGVYVLVNFNSTQEQDLERVYFLRDLGYDPYVMVYEKETAPREIKLLQRWVNNRFIFRSCPRFEDYDPRRR